MVPAPTIRRATPSDMPSVAKLAARLVRFHHALDPQRFFLQEPVEEGYRWWLSKELDDPMAVILVATPGSSPPPIGASAGSGAAPEEAGGSPAILGYAYGRLAERDWNALLDACGALHDVYVDETARAKGVGAALVEAMIRELLALGAPRVVLSTAARNTAAQRLFQKLGFRTTMLEMTRELE